MVFPPPRIFASCNIEKINSGSRIENFIRLNGGEGGRGGRSWNILINSSEMCQSASKFQNLVSWFFLLYGIDNRRPSN